MTQPIDWQGFVQLLTDETKESLYKEKRDELIASGLLSLEYQGNYYVVWDNSVMINPTFLPMRPSMQMYFKNSEDAMSYGKALFPNARIEVRKG